MKTERFEGFSDAVFAIIITIMVLELKVPEDDASFAALKAMLPKFISYVLSFIYVGIFWNNHHHMLHAVEKLKGNALWANLFLLFWISLIPFTTAWMGENDFDKNPVALYGFVLLMCAIAFTLLQRRLMAGESGSQLEDAVRSNRKEVVSMALYAAGMGVSFFQPLISMGLYGVVALMWLIPDKRIEEEVED